MTWYWSTRQFFVEWEYETFSPQVKEYLKEKQLPFKYLLVMDNATTHTQDLDDDLPGGFDFIKVKFLPPQYDTSSPTFRSTIHF